jgi:hypothetical protein
MELLPVLLPQDSDVTIGHWLAVMDARNNVFTQDHLLLGGQGPIVPTTMFAIRCCQCHLLPHTLLTLGNELIPFMGQCLGFYALGCSKRRHGTMFQPNTATPAPDE